MSSFFALMKCTSLYFILFLKQGNIILVFVLCGRGDNVYMHKKDMSIIVSDDMFLKKIAALWEV